MNYIKQLFSSCSCKDLPIQNQTQSNITPQMAMKQFGKTTTIPTKLQYSNTSQQLTKSHSRNERPSNCENQKKVSIRQSMEDKTTRKSHLKVWNKNNVSQIKKIDSLQEKEVLRTILSSIR